MNSAPDINRAIYIQMNTSKPARDVVRRISISALTFLFSFSAFAQQSDNEIDAFLATPVPTAPISEAVAKAKVEKGTALAADSSSRTNEIQAYLIPFQRVLVLGTSANQQPEAAAATPNVIARPKPFLIFKSSDGIPECFKAASFVTEGDFMVAKASDGKKGMWPKTRFVTQLPWYENEEMDEGNIDLETLALRYKVSIETYPAIEKALQTEMGRIQAIQRKHQEAAEQKKSALLQSVESVFAQSKSYSAENAYTREELAGILLNAESVRKLVPEQAQKIDESMAPFRTHFENLLANRVFSEGSWRKKSEVAAKQASKKTGEAISAFEQDFSIELNAESLSAGAIGKLRAILIILAVGIFGAGLYLILAKAKLAPRALGALICLTPASLGIYWNSHLSSNQSTVPSFSSEKPQGVNKVLRLLYLSSLPGTQQIPKLDSRITVREADLNSFLRDYVKFVGEPSTPDLGLYRTDLAVELTSNGITVWELSHYKGQSFRVRYDLKTDLTGAEAKISDFKVTVGSLSLPNFLGQPMLDNLLSELKKIKKGQGVLEAFKLTRLTEGETDLTSRTQR